MGIPRTLIETSSYEPSDFHVHTETGRARGALNSVLVVPREPATALADALHDLHDARGAVNLDTRLGHLAGRAPAGTAFVVTLEDQAWVFPSPRLHARLERDGHTETLTEPQVLRLLPGDQLALVEGADGEEVARVLAVAVPGATGVETSSAPMAEPQAATPRRAPTRRPSRVVIGGALAVIVVAVVGIRMASRSALPARSDAHVSPSLEQRVVDLVTVGGARSSDATDPAADAEPDERVADAPNDGQQTPPPPAATVTEGPASRAAVAAVAPWEFRTGGAITSSLLLADGRLYFGCRDAHLYCLDSATGDPIWSLPTSAGIGSSPRLAGELVLVGTYGGKLLAVGRQTGRVAWEASTGGRIVSSPCVVNDRVIVGSYDGSVHAFDVATGTRLWSQPIGAAVRASAERVGADGVVIGGGNGKLVHLSTTDGAIRWERTLSNAVHAQASWDDARGCVYVGTQGGTVVCLGAETGETRWSTAVGAEVNAQPHLAGDLLLVGTGNGALLALTPDDGESRWSAKADRGFDACPVVRDATVIAPSFDGTVHLLALASGEVLEQHSVHSEVFSSPAAGDGLLYVGTMGGTLHALALP